MKHVNEKFHDVNIQFDEEYDMPILSCVKNVSIDKLLPWTTKNREYNGTLHFWIDDYKFNSLVTYPKRYIPIIAQYPSVIQPDHSSYGNWNYNIQRHQQFLRQWVGAIWSYYAKVPIIPNIHLPINDDPKWNFMWAGIPQHSIVAISSQQAADRCQNQKEQEWFIHGFETMIERLEPRHVILYGGDIQYLTEKYKDLITRFTRHSFIGQQAEHKKIIYGSTDVLASLNIHTEQYDNRTIWDKKPDQLPQEELDMNLKHGKNFIQPQIGDNSIEQNSIPHIKKLYQQWNSDMLRVLQLGLKLSESGYRCSLNTPLGYRVLDLGNLYWIWRFFRRNILSQNLREDVYQKNGLMNISNIQNEHTQCLDKRSSNWNAGLLSNLELIMKQSLWEDLIQQRQNKIYEHQKYQGLLLHQSIFSIFLMEYIATYLNERLMLLQQMFQLSQEEKEEEIENIMNKQSLSSKSNMLQQNLLMKGQFPIEDENQNQKSIMKNAARGNMKRQQWFEIYRRIYQFKSILCLQIQFLKRFEKLSMKNRQNSSYPLTFMQPFQNERCMKWYMSQNRESLYNNLICGEQWQKHQVGLQENNGRSYHQQSDESHLDNIDIVNQNHMRQHGEEFLRMSILQQKHNYVEQENLNVSWKNYGKNLFQEQHLKYLKQDMIKPYILSVLFSDKCHLMKKLQNVYVLKRNNENQDFLLRQRFPMSLNNRPSFLNSNNNMLDVEKNNFVLTEKNNNVSMTLQNQSILEKKEHVKNFTIDENTNDCSNKVENNQPQNDWKNLEESSNQNSSSLLLITKTYKTSSGIQQNNENAQKKLYNDSLLSENDSNVLSRLSQNSKYLLVLNGLPATDILYQYCEKLNLNVQYIYLDHNWLFPEVKQFLIQTYPGIIGIPLQHRLTELLVKYGWPSMRGGNHSWHIRELEYSLDKYLQEFQLTELVPFPNTISQSVIDLRKKRKTPFVLPYLSEPIIPEYYTPSKLQELQELRDQSESHYIIPVKGLMYSSLRPKGEYEMMYRIYDEYMIQYSNVRGMTTLEGIWPELLRLDGMIKKEKNLFNSYSTLLDYIYEFEGRNLDKYVQEVEEIYQYTGRMITNREWRMRRIQKAIDEKKWMFALNHRSAETWYMVKPLEITDSGKSVRVVTQEGIEKSKLLPITNIYSQIPENYYGKRV